MCTEAQLYAATGHAAATLARRTGQAGDGEEARQRLTAAVELFDPAVHTRAWALCAARLALLHGGAGDQRLSARLGRQAAVTGRGIRSVRLERHLRAVAATVASGERPRLADDAHAERNPGRAG